MQGGRALVERVRSSVAGRLGRRRRGPLGRLLADAAEPSPGPDVWDRIWEQRRALVRQLAPGRSFLDLGGMFGVHGEVAFLAEECGATRVALFDGMDPTDEFAHRHRERASSVDLFQGDLHDPAVVDELGTFDVVWCTGVVYHSPHPLLQLQAIRRMTLETAVIGSLVLPEVPGIEQACMLYPGCGSPTQQVFADAYGGAGRFPGMSAPFDEAPLMAYANMWWGITPSALRAMLRYSGFTVTEQHQLSPFSVDLVARTGGVDQAIYPPHGQSHERLRARIESSGDVPAFARRQWAQLTARRS